MQSHSDGDRVVLGLSSLLSPSKILVSVFITKVAQELAQLCPRRVKQVCVFAGTWHRRSPADNHPGARAGGGLHQTIHEHRHLHYDQETGPPEARGVLLHGAFGHLGVAVHRHGLPGRQLRAVLRGSVLALRVAGVGGRRKGTVGHQHVHHFQHTLVLLGGLNAARVWYIPKVPSPALCRRGLLLLREGWSDTAGPGCRALLLFVCVTCCGIFHIVNGFSVCMCVAVDLTALIIVSENVGCAIQKW